MINFKTYFINRIIADPDLSAIIANGTIFNVFPSGVDIQPEQFPAITFADAGGTILSRPPGMHVNVLRVDIWSIINEVQVETMYGHLGRLFNYRDSIQDTTTGTLWWVREDGVRDLSEPSRRIWHKVVDLKYWYNNPNNL